MNVVRVSARPSTNEKFTNIGIKKNKQCMEKRKENGLLHPEEKLEMCPDTSDASSIMYFISLQKHEL